MSEAKRLLEQATPLPWHVRDRGIGFEVHVGDPAIGCENPNGSGWCTTINEGHRETMDEGDAGLVVYAVNRLPDYEAAVDALDALTGAANFISLVADEDVPSEESWRNLDTAVETARAALRRLRGTE